MRSRRSLALAASASTVGAAVAGVTVAALGLLVHRNSVDVGGVSMPWGFALALVASVAVSLGVASVRAGPLPVGTYGLAWCGTVLWLLGGRGEGDYLVAGDGIGWAFLGVASLGVVVATLSGIVTAAPRRSAGADPGDGVVVRRSPTTPPS